MRFAEASFGNMGSAEGAGELSARAVSLAVSLARHRAYQRAPRYDTNDRATTLVLRSVVHELVPVLHWVQGCDDCQ